MLQCQRIKTLVELSEAAEEWTSPVSNAKFEQHLYMFVRHVGKPEVTMRPEIPPFRVAQRYKSASSVLAVVFHARSVAYGTRPGIFDGLRSKFVWIF
jgi:hypothetical protein